MILLERVKKMNKEEFINKLRKRLNILEDGEIEDIVSEYEGYIDEKVSLGKTEEEAVKELGDFEEIVSDLLSAYKLKTSKDDNFFNSLLSKIGSFIDKFMDSLNEKSGRDIIKILIEVVLILFLICLLKIPFAMIRDLGTDIFEELIRPIGYVFASIWTFIIEVSYIIVAVIFFIKMIEKRCFKEISEEITTIRDKEEKKSKKEKTKSKKEEPIAEVKKEKVIKEKRATHTFSDTLTDICIWILKFIVIMIAIGIIFYLIGMSVALGLAIYLLINGVSYYGIFLLILVLFLGGALLLELCINFVFNRHTKALPFFTKLIVIIVLTGISLTMSAVEVANTEIIYGTRNMETKTLTKEIEMTNNLYLYGYDKVVIDNNLKNKIKIEYIYPNFNDNTEIEILLNHCHSDGYCLDTNVVHASWNKEYLKKLIENLKQQKLYTYDFYLEKVIYISEENYKTLEQNNHNGYYPDENIGSYTFEQTFNILNIAESNDENYLYYTLRKFQDENIETVQIPKSVSSNITETGLYKFTFECSNDRPHNIKSIFNNSKIINVEKVNTKEAD